MVSLPEELQVREAAARQRVGELDAEAAESAGRLERAPERGRLPLDTPALHPTSPSLPPPNALPQR